MFNHSSLIFVKVQIWSHEMELRSLVYLVVELVELPLLSYVELSIQLSIDVTLFWLGDVCSIEGFLKKIYITSCFKKVDIHVINDRLDKNSRFVYWF